MANLTVLDFLKSTAELDANLTKLRQIAEDPDNPQNSKELSGQIAGLEDHRLQVLRNIFEHLTPWDQVLLASHPNRPYTLDYLAALFEDFQELHGDRLFADDGAIVCGLAKFNDMSVVVAGHQKGRDIKQRQFRNFGASRPEGYRKAGRVMKLAAKFRLPIITFVDTTAAAADPGAEERGISEAIARSMYDMMTFPVPIVTVIIGEGGSGGALALAVADRVLMLEHAIYSVIPPAGCAAILWRDAEQKVLAAQELKLTAHDAVELGVVDSIIAEPLGGAHLNWEEAGRNVKEAIERSLGELVGVPGDILIEDRYQKFRRMGRYVEGSAVNG